MSHKRNIQRNPLPRIQPRQLNSKYNYNAAIWIMHPVLAHKSIYHTQNQISLLKLNMLEIYSMQFGDKQVRSLVLLL
jgi:hypothetical protein